MKQTPQKLIRSLFTTIFSINHGFCGSNWLTATNVCFLPQNPIYWKCATGSMPTWKCSSKSPFLRALTHLPLHYRISLINQCFQHWVYHTLTHWKSNSLLFQLLQTQQPTILDPLASGKQLSSTTTQISRHLLPPIQLQQKKVTQHSQMTPQLPYSYDHNQWIRQWTPVNQEGNQQT